MCRLYRHCCVVLVPAPPTEAPHDSTNCHLASLLLQLLLSVNDFIGISGYGSGYRLKQLSWRDMDVPLQTLAYELGFFGINLKEYTSRKPVIYVEQVHCKSSSKSIAAVALECDAAASIGNRKFA